MSSSRPGPSTPIRPWSRILDLVRRDPLWSHPDFVRLWSGKAISQFGNQLSIVAIPLYAVLALDASAFEMGLLAASAGAPRLLVGFVAGAWVDRLPRKPIMLVTDIGRAIAMATLPLAAVLGMESLALLIAVQVIVGLLSSFFQAAWVPYLPGLVGRAHLPSANSKIVASNSVSQVVGPSMAGTMVGVLGGPLTLAIDAVSYLWSALFIAWIEHREPPPARHGDRRSLRREMAEGLRVLMHSPLLRALTGSNATIVLAGHLFLAIYPLYMLDTLGLSARGVGLVYAAGGIGGLLGSVVATTLIRRLGTGPTIVWAAVLFGVFGLTIPLAVLAPAHALPLVVFAEFAQWMTLVIFEIAEGSLRQAVTPDHLLGRVAASDQVLAAGLQPFGAFLGGVLGQLVGVQEALLIGVAGMFCAGAWVFWSPVREIGAMPTAPDPALGATPPLPTPTTPAG